MRLSFQGSPGRAISRGLTLRVGAGCTYATIQAAIDSVPEDGSAVIRIRDALFEENLLIGNRNLLADPRFVDRASNRYYLASDSPGINYCSVAPPSPGVDLEWRPRGIVQPEQPERHGPYDLGAFETPYGLFSDRFESP